jgi:hypothetical protein
MKKDPPDLASFSKEDLLAELARRSVGAATSDMSAIERSGEALACEVKARTMSAQLAELERAEGTGSRPCPRCGRATPVKGRKRTRRLVTMSGEHVLSRNYHYCATCRAGWYPLDADLGLAKNGELTPEVERRLLDFGVHDTFEDAAERWSLHYGTTVSENLVRRVVERVGERMESCDAEELQRQLEPAPETPTELLVIGVDGSMVPTRGPDPWREAKLAVIYRSEDHRRSAAGGRGAVEKGRFLAVVGNKAAIAAQIRAALAVENVEKARQAVWLGDGAPWIWNLAEELAPDAHQVLDWPHVAHHIDVCRKALFGDDVSGEVWRRAAENLVWHGELDLLLHELETCIPECVPAVGQTSAIADLMRYVEANEERLNYAAFREAGFPVGSGFVESGHRHVLQARMKRAGQHWDPQRANRMSQLRAALRTAGAARLHGAIQGAALQLAA